MGLDFVSDSTGGMGPKFAHKTLESQFRLSLLTANDVFFIIEVLGVQIAIGVNNYYSSKRTQQTKPIGLVLPIKPGKWGRYVESSKPDSTKRLTSNSGPDAAKSEAVGQVSSRWCSAEAWREGCQIRLRPLYLTSAQNYELSETPKSTDAGLPPSQETVNFSLPQDLLANKDELADLFRVLKQMQIILDKVPDIKKTLEEIGKTEDPSNKLFILEEELNDNT
ncbi:hypothetical protein AVEN_212781-1 [Araneus ventricosus]|uniref:Uncharacterized protein n=1 Tax=Araneus ventricosus TaxID=182803 RepID=A0A4Y2RVZ8_ARAVE|nr:hypothetical protein AVEN_212781-1 [Araneus ventricosus]